MDVFLIFFIIALTFCIITALIYVLRYIVRISKEDPTIWEKSIRKFEKQDRLSPPTQRTIVFTGSSSIVYWKTLKEDMAPLPVIGRGFGGSRIPDVIHYADRVVLHYRPQGIVFYAGENDITGLVFSKKKSPEEVLNSFRIFCEKIHTSQPDVPIFFISIKPPKRRKKFWPEMQKANELIQEFCTQDERLDYIDVVPALLDQNKNPRTDVFKWDGIHLNEKGYMILSSVVKPILLEAFPIS
ncbi:MAG: GDSL-type esterase/lipase family protein [Promethearchaeota archaeon]